jgi:hypothetical protein
MREDKTFLKQTTSILLLLVSAADVWLVHACPILHTSRKRAFGQDPLVPASIWAGTKGPATSPEIRQPPWRL